MKLCLHHLQTCFLVPLQLPMICRIVTQLQSVFKAVTVGLFPKPHTHTRLTALCPGLPWWAGTRKVKPIWILLKQETVCGSGISWAICKSASRSRQITTPAPTTQFFTDRMPFLPPNQQRQSTEGFPNQLLSNGFVHYESRHETIISLNVNRFSTFFHWQIQVINLQQSHV